MFCNLQFIYTKLRYNNVNVSKARYLSMYLKEAEITFMTFSLCWIMCLCDYCVLFVDGVQPVCLPRPSESFPPGAACWITGWGYINERGVLHRHKPNLVVLLVPDSTHYGPSSFIFLVR